MRTRGVSLLEVVIALGLLALTVPLVLNLLPTSALALQRAEDLQAATALGLRVLDEMREAPVDGDEDVDLNGTRFHLARRAYLVAPGIHDLVVTVRGPRGEPVRLATRMRDLPPAEEGGGG